VKTNRRDALSLAKLLRADELTPGLGAGRTVTRRDARSDAGARDGGCWICARKRQHVSAFLLRLGKALSREQEDLDQGAWRAGSRSQKLEHPQQRLVLEEMMLAIRQRRSACNGFEQGHRRNRSGWSLAAGGHRIDGRCAASI